MKLFNIFIGDLFKVYTNCTIIHSIINTTQTCTTITEFRIGNHEYSYIYKYFERIE